VRNFHKGQKLDSEAFLHIVTVSRVSLWLSAQVIICSTNTGYYRLLHAVQTVRFQRKVQLYSIFWDILFKNITSLMF